MVTIIEVKHCSFVLLPLQECFLKELLIVRLEPILKLIALPAECWLLIVSVILIFWINWLSV